MEKMTIDITPTWVSLHPLYSQWIREGSEEQKKLVCDELLKLCRIVDHYKKEKLC